MRTTQAECVPALQAHVPGRSATGVANRRTAGPGQTRSTVMADVRIYDPFDRTTFDAIMFNAIGRASEVGVVGLAGCARCGGQRYRWQSLQDVRRIRRKPPARRWRKAAPTGCRSRLRRSHTRQRRTTIIIRTRPPRSMTRPRPPALAGNGAEQVRLAPCRLSLRTKNKRG